ncbi:MAG TPA: WXG100 family type VII secretion target [Thermomicrobiaceae bacterium]|nr:WXG100 family type VII secretion target [Thermomicrobiaceae bacterium]
MSNAIADPAELERFARELDRFNRQLAESTARLQAEFNRLGDSWRDQERLRFVQEFDQTMRVLRQFLQSSERQVPFLTRKARRLRDYLGQP